MGGIQGVITQGEDFFFFIIIIVIMVITTKASSLFFIIIIIFITHAIARFVLHCTCKRLGLVLHLAVVGQGSTCSGKSGNMATRGLRTLLVLQLMWLQDLPSMV